jgi:hypothetical protein
VPSSESAARLKLQSTYKVKKVLTREAWISYQDVMAPERKGFRPAESLSFGAELPMENNQNGREKKGQIPCIHRPNLEQSYADEVSLARSI